MAEPKKRILKKNRPLDETVHDSSCLHLGYGHVGTPYYDIIEKQWMFKRCPRIHRPLRLLLQNSEDDEHPSAATNQDSEAPARRLKRQTDRLLQDFPELIPALDLLPGNAQTSEAVTEVSRVYDPQRGALSGFGGATNRRGRDGVRICATPGGDAGECLRLMQVRNGVSGWTFEEDVGIETRSLDGLTGIWTGNGAPILQICFSDSLEDGEQYLAVRFPTIINIFRPTLHRSTSAATHRQRTKISGSSLQPNEVISIPLTSQGKCAFADVTFNPWYRKNVATVDEHGNWAVYETRGVERSSRMSYALSVEARGSLDDQLTVHWDGWHRVLWICNAKTLVVSDRRDVALFELSPQPRLLNRMDLGLVNTPGWILDMKQVPGERNYLFVITSTNALLVNAGALLRLDFDPKKIAIRRVAVLSWSHFRDKDDISLNVSLYDDGANGLLAMVYSKLNMSVTCFRFEIDGPGGSACSLSDPTTIDLGLVLPNIHPARRIDSLNLSSSNYISRSHGKEATVQHGFLDQHVSFLQLSICLDDYSIGLYICYSSPSGQISVEPFEWEKKARMLKSELEVDEETVEQDFLSNDFYQYGEGHGRTAAMSGLIHEGGPADDLTRDSESWAVDYEDVYQALIKDDSSDVQSFDETLEVLKGQLEDEEMSRVHTSRTINELAGPLGLVPNVNNVSSAFDEFIQLEIGDEEPGMPKRGLRTLSQNLNSDLWGPRDSDVSILSTYDYITRHWLGELPQTVPRRLLMTKERVARQAAVEVALSSYRISPLETHSGAEAKETEESNLGLPAATDDTPTEGHSFSLPMRPPNKGKGVMTMESSQPFPSSAPSYAHTNDQLRTPEPTPSMASTSFSSAFLNAGGSLALTSLRQHAHVSKPPVILSGTMSRILSHWNVGEDPAEYDFEAKSLELAQASEGKDLSAKERRRIERKMKKRLRQERRDNEIETAKNDPSKVAVGGNMSQPLPPVVFGSSPGRSVMPSSQPAMASQIETGKFGARPSKKRKKTRMSGF